MIDAVMNINIPLCSTPEGGEGEGGGSSREPGNRGIIIMLCLFLQ